MLNWKMIVAAFVAAFALAACGDKDGDTGENHETAEIAR